MKMVLVAIILSPCNSIVQPDLTANSSIVHVCPSTVRTVWHEKPETPMDFARQRHWRAMPRDDRPPIVTVQKQEPKKAVKKRKPKKKKRRR